MNQNENYKVKLESNINNLVNKRNSNALLIYITGDKRPTDNFGAQVHPEVLPIFYEHLKLIGKQKKISLLLYTTGGALETPWALVNLIREFCYEFEVLVPFKAFSAGTLICLGADDICTTSLSLFTPIDPTGTFFDGKQKKSVQVENIVEFINFAKKRIGLRSQDCLKEVLKSLVSDTSPQILGNIHRTYILIRQLVEKMISLRIKPIPLKQKNKIKENLTEKLYSHQHLINRKELVKIGFVNMIEELETSQENDLLNIFDYFSAKMELMDEFDPAKKLGSNNQFIFKLPRAIISSKKLTHTYSSEYTIVRDETQPGLNIFLNVKNLGWQKEEI
ncbi:MAG: hypothetical protein M1371_04060 [Actinobacteria bacterium]|nr:hypothetical protein [Actinomycetota bacterium]MCL5985723.1 hypothetical protein [Actinomycetota bacterium]